MKFFQKLKQRWCKPDPVEPILAAVADRAEINLLKLQLHAMEKLLRQCAVAATTTAGDSLEPIASAMNRPLEEIPELVNDNFADLECKAAQAETARDALQLEVNHLTLVEKRLREVLATLLNRINVAWNEAKNELFREMHHIDAMTGQREPAEGAATDA